MVGVQRLLGKDRGVIRRRELQRTVAARDRDHGGYRRQRPSSDGNRRTLNRPGPPGSGSRLPAFGRLEREPELFGQFRVVLDLQYSFGDVFAEHRPLLEGFGRPQSREPHVVEVGMLVDEEVAARTEAVVAGARLVDRRAHQVRKVALEDLARPLVGLRRHPAVAGVGVVAGLATDPHAEAAVVRAQSRPARTARDAVARHVRKHETPVRHREVEDVAHGDAYPVPEQFRKRLPHPGPHREHERRGLQRFVAAQRDVVQPATVRSAESRARDPDLASLHLEPLCHGFDGPPRPHDPRVRFMEAQGDALPPSGSRASGSGSRPHRAVRGRPRAGPTGPSCLPDRGPSPRAG